MSVYVDDATRPKGRMKMAHMVADTREELLMMAGLIGINRRWLQHEGTHREHFDICKAKRDVAVRCYGAIPTTSRAIVAMIRKRRAKAGAADGGETR